MNSYNWEGCHGQFMTNPSTGLVFYVLPLDESEKRLRDTSITLYKDIQDYKSIEAVVVRVGESQLFNDKYERIEIGDVIILGLRQKYNIL